MKATGITRKVDGLGRVVIPKELRRNLGIKENDSLEIYVDNDFIMLRKYDMGVNLRESVDRIAGVVLDFYNEDNRNDVLDAIKALKKVIKA